MKGLFLLTDKPVIYCANVGEDQLGDADDEFVGRLSAVAKAEGAGPSPSAPKSRRSWPTWNPAKRPSSFGARR